MSSAISVNGDVYVVDFGRNWLDRFYQAGLGDTSKSDGITGLQSLRAGFITHLHADHVVDYPRLLLFGATDGLALRKKPVQIFGPGRRGSLPKSNKGIINRRAVNPSNPTPGTVDMTRSLYAAFATDLNDNIFDSGMPNPDSYIQAHDIDIPKSVNASAENMSPPMDPFLVYQDENVKVTAILVSHPEVYPAFAFRFDTAAGSVVFSGDTNRNANLIKLAKGADVLVHEVIDMEWAQNRYHGPLTPAQLAKLDHLRKSHTPVEQVGSIAQEAGVKMLILSHLGPPTTSDESWLSRIKDFKGRVVVGKPMMEIDLADLSLSPAPKTGN